MLTANNNRAVCCQNRYLIPADPLTTNPWTLLILLIITTGRSLFILKL